MGHAILGEFTPLCLHGYVCEPGLILVKDTAIVRSLQHAVSATIHSSCFTLGRNVRADPLSWEEIPRMLLPWLLELSLT